MKSLRTIVTALLLWAPALAGQSSSTTRINEVVRQLQQTHSFASVSVSPDGNWVTWGEPAQNDPGKNQIFLLNWKQAGAQPRPLTLNEGKQAGESKLAWSPDSQQVVFLAHTEGSQDQLYVAAAASGHAHRLTDLNGYVTDPKWATDGKRIAFLYAENGGGAGALAAVPAQTGEIESALHNQRLTIVNTEGEARPHAVSPAELNVYEYDWSPDGRRFAAIAAPGPADNNWWIAKLYLCDAATGAMQVLYQPPRQRQLAVPRWSPDGKEVAFLGGLMSDQGFNGGDIFLISSAGGEPRNLTAQRKTTPTWFGWRNANELVLTEDVEGGGAITQLQVSSGQTEMLWRGTQQLHDAGNNPNFSLAADGRTSALIRTSWEQPPEVWAGPVGNWQQLTRENAAQHPDWGKAESMLWNNNGQQVQGWLLYPAEFDPAKHYPMIVEIHGGPSNMRSNYWPTAHFDMSSMAALGYFVFFPNSRGSYGEGEAFTRANIKDFGNGDLHDVLSGVQAVLKKAPVDAERIGVAGWSYGGFMTMWAVTQTNLFHAAVAGAGIANWLSYYGENSIDEWMIPFFGASVYDDPEVYAKSSPINYVKQVKTPTLVLVGERDGECPAPQSFEFWHALKTLGVPTRLVVYPGEGHGFRDPKDDADRLRRTLAWFDQYLGARPAS